MPSVLCITKHNNGKEINLTKGIHTCITMSIKVTEKGDKKYHAYAWTLCITQAIFSFIIYIKEILKSTSLAESELTSETIIFVVLVFLIKY